MLTLLEASRDMIPLREVFLIQSYKKKRKKERKKGRKKERKEKKEKKKERKRKKVWFLNGDFLGRAASLNSGSFIRLSI